MKRVLFLTNYPSPYRVRFFDELGTYMDVTVLFSERPEEKKHRSAAWFEQGQGRFRLVQLEKRAASVQGRALCLDVTKWLKQPWDAIVLCGYSGPTVMLAMTWLKAHKVPFWLEVDGGLVRQEGKAKYLLKKTLVSSASGWLSTGKATTDYLVHYGADPARVRVYPFSSLMDADILEKVDREEEKAALRQELGILEKRMILTIGQFIHRKGFDVLMEAAASLPKDVGIYIVGGEPTEEYRQLREKLGLDNLHFVGFQKKEVLAKYYRGADLFVLPTREDIWGLVINEAMAYGLPVITTDRCVAGVELVENGVNGEIVATGDAAALEGAMHRVLAGDLAEMGRHSLEKVRPYTIENMAKVHVDILESGI